MQKDDSLYSHVDCCCCCCSREAGEETDDDGNARLSICARRGMPLTPLIREKSVDKQLNRT